MLYLQMAKLTIKWHDSHILTWWSIHWHGEVYTDMLASTRTWWSIQWSWCRHDDQTVSDMASLQVIGRSWSWLMVQVHHSMLGHAMCIVSYDEGFVKICHALYLMMKDLLKYACPIVVESVPPCFELKLYDSAYIYIYVCVCAYISWFGSIRP